MYDITLSIICSGFFWARFVRQGSDSPFRDINFSSHPSLRRKLFIWPLPVAFSSTYILAILWISFRDTRKIFDFCKLSIPKNFSLNPCVQSFFHLRLVSMQNCLDFLSLLNYVGCVGSWVAWVAWVRGCMGGVGRNFCVGDVGPWNSFIEKALLNISQNLQGNICAGVSSQIKLQIEGAKIH